MLNYNEMLQTKEYLQKLQEDVCKIKNNRSLWRAVNLINKILEYQITESELNSKEVEH